MASVHDIEQIEDEDALESMAAQTEDIQIKLAIRRKQKVIREKRLANFEANKLERRNNEDATKMRLRMAEMEKQRKMKEFEEQARLARLEIGESEKAVRLRQTLADEEKQRKLDQYKKMALTMTASYNSGVSEYLDEKNAKKAGNTRPTTAPRQLETTQSGFGGTAYGSKSTSSGNQVIRTSNLNGQSFNPNTVKQVLLDWCKAQVTGYQNVDVTNFSSSWSDGLAFCALIHHFHPEAFDFTKLTPKNRRGNFTLAFDTADKLADIYPMLDVDDMVKMKNPDWKSVFTYVQAFYQKFSKAPAVGAD